MVNALTDTLAGNTDLTPISVAGYTNCHFFLSVTAITGIWRFTQRALVPIAPLTSFMDVQDIFVDISSPGNYYAPVGNMGIVTDMSVAWDPTSAGSITFSLVAVLKEGSLQTSGSLSKTIYIGGPDITLGSGMPIYEGESKILSLNTDMSLYAISAVTTNPVVITL
jgi:hypothetical protein